MGKSNVTMETIARHLGVSKMTVSNAYNHPDQLSPKLRDRILETAHLLGYPGPNPLASTLRRGKTGTIGLVFEEPVTYMFTDPAAVLFVRGMAAACDAVGAALLLVPSANSDHGFEVAMRALVDGFVTYSEEDSRVKALAERGLPVVVVEATPQPGMPWIGLDDRAAAREAARHLLSLGHRRFGVISLCSTDDIPEGLLPLELQSRVGYRVSRERLAGYREALEASGIVWADVPVLIRRALIDPRAAGREGAAELLDRADRPTAILVMSDAVALGVLEAARARGISVPRELSIVGFDDIPEAALSQPPLTTIHQPHAQKGEAAVHAVLDPDQAAARLTLQTRLVVRASTGPAPRREAR
jgi:DNA-binding LacI/PurR family transcriptional regulator